MNTLTQQEIDKALETLAGWEQMDDSIQTAFEFKDFKDAFSVMTRIALEAESMNHHPLWTNVYNSLEISLSTHDAGGITQKDIDLAKAIEFIVGDE